MLTVFYRLSAHFQNSKKLSVISDMQFDQPDYKENNQKRNHCGNLIPLSFYQFYVFGVKFPQ